MDVDGPTLTVRVDVVKLPDGGVTGLALKVVVTPVGAPVTDRVTGELKSISDPIVIVDVSDAP